MEVDRVLRFRRTSNFIGGLVATTMLWIILIVFVDPLHAYSTYSDAPDETLLEALPLYGVFVAVALAIHTLLVRPNVTVSDRTVAVRNPLRTYIFALSGDVEFAESAFGYGRFRAPQWSVSAWGIDTMPRTDLHERLAVALEGHSYRSASQLQAKVTSLDRWDFLYIGLLGRVSCGSGHL